ncbi:MAG: DUF1223 domain-containing protein [Rhodospirillales bacterium]
MSLLASFAHAGEKLTVVELYTSQGCSSCPPADAYLGTLAKRDDILALSFHVDYWDYIGWKDPFSLPANSTRQRSYARNLGMGYVYTPQMVIQGMTHTTGSNSGDVERMIRDLQGAKRLDIDLTPVSDGLRIDIPGGTFDGEEAQIVVVTYDKRHENDVTRGENSGRKLAHYNVVREMTGIGAWSGEPVSITLTEQMIAMAGHDGCAVLVQSSRNGRILGAARIGLLPQG